MDTSYHRVRLEQEEKHICSYKNLHQLVKVPAKSKSTIVSFLTHERDMICTNGFLFSMKTLMNRIHILTQSMHYTHCNKNAIAHRITWLSESSEGRQKIKIRFDQIFEIETQRSQSYYILLHVVYSVLPVEKRIGSVLLRWGSLTSAMQGQRIWVPFLT